MPLKRTPPPTPVKGKEDSGSRVTLQSGSSPDLSSLGQDTNITTRLKRKRADCDCSCRLDEIRAMLTTSTAQSENKLAEIISQNEEIMKSLTTLTAEYDDMKVQLNTMAAERESDRRYIRELEERVDRLDRQQCSTKIEIRNVPIKENENKEDLCTIVTETAMVLGHTLQSSEIKDIFRTKTKNDSNIITVELTSAITKDAIIKKARKFNKDNKDNKLNSTHLKIEGPKKPIYLSEKLTLKDQRLYYLARRFADSHAYKYCWTSFGKVLLRKKEGDRQIIIKKEADLDSLQRKE